jgi:hypothetical protein
MDGFRQPGGEIYHKRLSQNFSFEKAALDLWKKTGLKALFQELFLKSTGFWEKLIIGWFRNFCF